MEKDDDKSAVGQAAFSDFIESWARQAATSGETGDVGVAKIDHGRTSRCGFPEFVYGEGKTFDQLLAIVPEIIGRSGGVLVTRISPESGRALAEKYPEGRHDPQARVFYLRSPQMPRRSGRVMIVTAGTCDLPVALEARYTLDACGIDSELIADVGVAAIHRLFAVVDRLRSAAACIVAAGLDGALPSVVAGLTGNPVIAVPTSIGYGASFKGVAPLLGMLNSCSSGLVVVNIDNGFGAGCAAARIINSR